MNINTVAKTNKLLFAKELLIKEAKIVHESTIQHQLSYCVLCKVGLCNFKLRGLVNDLTEKQNGQRKKRKR